MSNHSAVVHHEARTVLKYELKIGENNIDLPVGSVTLMAAEQDGRITIWVEAPYVEDRYEQQYMVYGTGWPQKTDRCHTYYGTVIMEGGLVWHVYETHQHTEEELDALTQDVFTVLGLGSPS